MALINSTVGYGAEHWIKTGIGKPGSDNLESTRRIETDDAKTATANGGAAAEGAPRPRDALATLLRARYLIALV